MPKKVKFHLYDEILEERIRNGQVEYLIKWKEYSSKWNSWEPKNNFREEPEKASIPKKTIAKTRTTKKTIATTNKAVASAKKKSVTTDRPPKLSPKTRAGKRTIATTLSRSTTKVFTSSPTQKRVTTASPPKLTPKTRAGKRTIATTLHRQTKIAAPSKKSKNGTKSGGTKATQPTTMNDSAEPTLERRETKKSAQEYYDIEKILAKRIVNSKIQYLVHWKGFHEDESTWEPEDRLKGDYEENDFRRLKHAFI